MSTKVYEHEYEEIAGLLAQSAALHDHLCPRQVLGVRMGLLASILLQIPFPQVGKRVLAISETDGCFVDGLAVAANCWVGHRTLRIEDYGKVAATVIDSQTDRAVRIAPHPGARTRAAFYAPHAASRWHAMLEGYQRMPAHELLVTTSVRLRVPVKDLISRADHRVECAACGEEVLNEREVIINDRTLCHACAYSAYYIIEAER